MNLDSAILYTNDIARIRKFYEKEIGLKFEYQDGNHFVSFIFPNGARLGINKSNFEREKPGHQTVFIETNKIKRLYQKFKKKYEVVEDYAEYHWGKYFAILDPDGNKVGFVDKSEIKPLESEWKAAWIIDRIEYLNLATVTKNNQAWNSPVYTAYDKKLNFYWVSWRENQHSLNLKSNDSAFVTIYDSTLPAGEGVGLYLQGTAKKLTNPKDMITGLRMIYNRQDKKVKAIEQFMKKFPRRVYKFTPEKAWLNGRSDVDKDSVDVRIELDLNKIRELL